jgi:PhnB protein
VGMLMRFKDAPPEACPEGGAMPAGTENKVMHAALQIGGTTVMASDGRNTGAPNFQGFALSLDAASDDEAKRLFDALSDGGQVHMPLGKTFFASSFGMIADKFGVSWMVIKPAM